MNFALYWSIRILVSREVFGLWAKRPSRRSRTILLAVMVSFNDGLIGLNFLGEGMKIGIIALLRQNCRVTYYTNREIWTFHFHLYHNANGEKPSKKLSVGLASHHPKKAKQDTSISEDVRQARIAAGEDTTVIIEGSRPLNIRFEDYLFLVNPPEKEQLKTELGTIIIADQYRSKVFVKGIFVEEMKGYPHLHYGVDFCKAALDRDRRSLMTGAQVAATLAEIWNDLIERDEEDAADRYLQLLLSDVAENAPYDILHASHRISRVSAKRLLEKLQALCSPNSFFYCEDGKAIEVVSSLSLS